ncbi:MAG: hypothetical protein HY290_11210 [Planctomycetia bacterium]|nr:hypothetical protein [Planctomycetia bacterium]
MIPSAPGYGDDGSLSGPLDRRTAGKGAAYQTRSKAAGQPHGLAAD